MRRVRYHTHGGPEVLTIEETGIPEPGPGQVLIRTEAIGVNYVDVQLRRETSPDSIYFRSLPATLTGDVVGTVTDVGSDADPNLVGTRVATLLEDAYADYVVADTDWLINVPEQLDAGAASMLPTVGAVALGALRTGRLNKSDTVLITAGAGAIGHLAVQLAKRQGAGTVIATASSPAKLDFLKKMGADVAIDHTRSDWAAQVRAAAPGGIDVTLEAVGGEVLHKSIELLAPFGRVVAYGASAGDLTSVPVTSLFALKTVAGFSLLAWRAAHADQARADITELTGLLQTGGLHAAAHTRLPLTKAAQAHQLLEDRAVLGRLLLMP
jgi:NADPH:quinone reductase